MKTIAYVVAALFALAGPADAYEINGFYARLVTCNYEFSAVRGESGYTGIYEAMGELFSIYFGPNYCEY